MPKNEEKGLHANRKHSVPVAGGVRNCFSRQDILDGRTPCAFGSSQSMQVCVDSNGAHDPSERPRNWPGAGRVLRVPKVVILSSLPFWTAWWKSCYFYGPRDVIGEDLLTGALGNYYYFEQWNDIDSTEGISADYGDGSSYSNNQYWRNFDSSLTETDKNTVYNAKASCRATSQGDPACDAIPDNMINDCRIPPRERFSRIVGRVSLNPYYALHKRLMEAFVAAKFALESDPVDPIYVIIPEWMPEQLYQIRNSFLKKQHEELRADHGGSVNDRPCDVSDAIPCYNLIDVCWAPPYPNVNDPRNGEPFTTPQVPWLSSVHPGFGTNVLHIYVGHPCMKYAPSNSIWDFQAWPLTPEGQWITGSILESTYLGSTLPFFAGRRPIWRSLGFDYGYTGMATPRNLYDNRYGPIVEGAAGTYKQEWLNYRNFETWLFTYPATWTIDWTLDEINKDKERTCPSTQFFFGFDVFGDFAAFYDTEDNLIEDCEDQNPAHLKYGETFNQFPAAQSIRDALESFFPPIVARIEEYYNGIEPGSAEFFRIAIEENGLAEYGVSYNGSLPGALFDIDVVVANIRGYFDLKSPS